MFEPYNITPYKSYISDFSFQILQYYTLLLNSFKKYFSVLQNYTLLQTICFCSKYFFWTLQCYTLRIVIFQIFLFQPYNITHYFEIFFSISNYTLLQTFCFCSKHFVWTLRCYTLQIVFFQNFLFQPYNITHYRLCVSFYSLLHLNLAFLEILQIKINNYKITLLHCYTFIQLQLTLQKVCKDL